MKTGEQYETTEHTEEPLCTQKYKGKDISKHRIDYLVEDEVSVELKAVETMHRIYEAPVLTHVRALGKRVGLLINFNVVLLNDGIKRLIL